MKFKLGDTVRVISHRYYDRDRVGRITTIDKYDIEGLPFLVTSANPHEQLWYGPHELVLAEKDEAGS